MASCVHTTYILVDNMVFQLGRPRPRPRTERQEETTDQQSQASPTPHIQKKKKQKLELVTTCNAAADADITQTRQTVVALHLPNWNQKLSPQSHRSWSMQVARGLQDVQPGRITMQHLSHQRERYKRRPSRCRPAVRLSSRPRKNNSPRSWNLRARGKICTR